MMLLRSFILLNIIITIKPKRELLSEISKNYKMDHSILSMFKAGKIKNHNNWKYCGRIK